MSGAVATNIVLHDESLTHGPDLKHQLGQDAHIVDLPQYFEGTGPMLVAYMGEGTPTDEELKTLIRVPAKINFSAYTIAFVELAERFSFYGTTVVYTNFIKNPLLRPTGRAPIGDDPNTTAVVAGALNMGAQAANGITTFNQFWCYIIPLVGAWIADTYLGRYNTVMIAVFIAIVGHVILTASGAPGVLEDKGHALACFIIGLVIMGLGTGMFKPNISPMVAEQMPMDRMYVRTNPKTSRREIVDPAVTTTRVYNWFYLFINIGALVGQLTMSYSAYYVGFWLAFLLPTLVFLTCPLVLYFCRNKYIRSPPQGSVLGPAMKLWVRAQKGRWSLNPVTTYKKMNDGTFWEKVKPSNIPESERPKWMTFDDAWVDEVRRGFLACKVFLWYPLYWIAYNNLNNNLTAQASIMALHGIPNDILNNLDPLALIILIPVCDLIFYPALRRWGINFSPIKRITLGFLTGSLAMIWALVIQIYIYKDSNAGDQAYSGAPVSINVWAQTGSYVLIAISEIFASITSLEYAFSKAPKNMRSLVMAFSLFMSAIAAAIGEAFNPLSADPLLNWNYGVAAVLSGVGGILFWLQFRGQDLDEDKLNMLPTGHIGTQAQAVEFEMRRSSVVYENVVNEKAY